MIKYVLIQKRAKLKKKKTSIFGVDFDQYFYVSIDFVLNTAIEHSGQNQPPKLTYFREIMQTAV